MTRLPQTLAFLALGLVLALPTAQAQDEVARMERRAVQAAISGMNTANDGSNDIRYDGQPGEAGVKQGDLSRRHFIHVKDYHFVQKRGARASRAIDAIFRGPTRLECNTMMIAIEYRAIKAAIGRERFDRAFASRRKVRIEIGAALETRVLGRWLSSEEANLDTLKLGDWVYFANHPDYLFKHPAGAWQGENALYVGDNDQGEKLFSGFGVHSVTAAKMKHELLTAYNRARSSADDATALRDRTPEEKQRREFMGNNSLVLGATEDEAVASAASGMALEIDDLEYDVIQDTPGNVIIEVLYEFPADDYEDQLELEDIPGLVQVLRLDMVKLVNLGKRRTRTVTASANARGLAGAVAAD